MFRKHPAKFRQDIMGQHPVLAALCGGAVGGGTVQVYRAGSGLIGGQTAGQQRRQHPRQYIPAAAPVRSAPSVASSAAPR